MPIDCLFGLIDEWDAADPESFQGRNLLAGLQRLELENFTKTATEQIRQDGRIKAINTAVVELVMRIQSLSEVVNRFMQINPTFQDMAGSAPVLRQTKLAENAGSLATRELTRYKALPESLANHAEQMNEFFPSHNGSFSD